jgi:hypothetical protein
MTNDKLSTLGVSLQKCGMRSGRPNSLGKMRKDHKEEILQKQTKATKVCLQTSPGLKLTSRRVGGVWAPPAGAIPLQFGLISSLPLRHLREAILIELSPVAYIDRAEKWIQRQLLERQPSVGRPPVGINPRLSVKSSSNRDPEEKRTSRSSSLPL